MSITDELRKYATVSWNPWPASRDRLFQLCDRIDAEHERLCSRSRSNGYSDGFTDGFNDIESWVIDHEDAMAEHGWVRLPKDADGAPIHVGDVMEWIDLDGEVSLVFTVEAVGTDCFFAWDKSTGRFVQKEASAYRHYYATTVKDVLRKVVTLCHNTWKKESPFHFYDVDDVMKSGNIAEYAAKLRLAEGEDA